MRLVPLKTVEIMRLYQCHTERKHSNSMSFLIHLINDQTMDMRRSINILEDQTWRYN